MVVSADDQQLLHKLDQAAEDGELVDWKYSNSHTLDLYSFCRFLLQG